jgi:hypothetical protein
MSSETPEYRDYSASGKIGFIAGVERNGLTVAISPDSRQGMLKIGSEVALFEDAHDIDLAMGALRRLRSRLSSAPRP